MKLKMFLIRVCMLHVAYIGTAVCTNCPSESEIVVLMDESGSIRMVGFNKMKEFVAELVDGFVIGSNRFSVTTFHHRAIQRFDLGRYLDKDSLKSAIMNLTYNRGGTDIAGALQHARQQSFNSSRPGVPKVLLLITDGVSSGNIKEEADLLKLMNVTIYCIGVGSGVNETLLRRVSTNDSYTVIVNTTDLLMDIKDHTASRTCSQGRCTSVTCDNNGSCEQHGTRYVCRCPPEYYGTFCEEKDECFTNPCMHNSTCQNTPGSYFCDCLPGWQGFHCESEKDECLTNPCMHNSTCQNTPGSYSCYCLPGWQGFHCESDVDECSIGTPCQHGGTCVNTPGSFSCVCPSGMTGPTCETEKDECLTNPCMHNSTCQNTPGSYSCYCLPGWQGFHCESDVDECSIGTPCQHGGTCVNTPGSFSCVCPSGMTGPTCETDLCKTKPAELVFLVKSSLSTSAEWFAKQINFVKTMVQKLTFVPDGFKVSAITYCHKAFLDIGFGEYRNKSELLAKIDNISKKNGSTNIKQACNLARNILARRNDAWQFVFLMTDGMPSNFQDAKEGVTELREHIQSSNLQNKLYFVSAGYDVRPQGIAALSSDSLYYKDVFTTLNDDALFETFRNLVDPQSCSATYHYETDLVFLIDVGGQQPYWTFELQMNLLAKFVRRLNILNLGKSYTQVAAITFSSGIQHKLWLNSTYDATVLSSLLSAVNQDRSNSTSDVAHVLDFVRTEVFSTSHGARLSSRKMIILPVTGHDKDEGKTLDEIQKLKKDGIVISAVGVGAHFSDDTVLSFASDALFAAFTEEDISDQYVRMLLKHVAYYTCTSRVNSYFP